VVDKAPTTLTTTASGNITLGSGDLTDTAHLLGATADAGGTITFELFYNDDDCDDATNNSLVFTSNAVPVLGPGDYVSDPAYTPTKTGTYYWKATYTGDNKNSPATHVCNDTGESVVVSSPPFIPPPPDKTPGIHIEKTGPAQAQAGSAVTYLLDVSNTGETSFPEANVVVTDPLCSSSPTLINPGGKPNDNSTTTMDPGDHWFYMCSVQTAAGQTSIHNVATATGNDGVHPPVSDDDPADTTLIQPQIAVEPLLPGSARLRGPAGCLASGPHKMVLTGRRISRVKYYLDGKLVATKTKADKLGRFTYTVNRKNLRTGVHTITARVTYLPNTTGGTKTFRRTFAKCARALKPAFTG